MLDRHDTPNDQNIDKPRGIAHDPSMADRTRADREVPLPGSPAPSAIALHAWLDGDVSESDARRMDQKSVELWGRIASETDRRRRMTTPSGLAGQIMAALPDREVSLQTQGVATLADTEGDRSVGSSAAVVVGAGFFALGIVVGRMFGR